MKKTDKQSWFNISRSDKVNTHGKIYVYDEIGLWGVTAKDFADELNALTGLETIDMHVKCDGGSVVEVVAMMNALERHPAKITAFVDAIAASSASRLILAADEVEIAENAFIMIHNVMTPAFGNAEELRQTAEVLEKFDQGLANDYNKKTGKDINDILNLMAEDTWFNAEEALEFGIVDRIGAEQKAAACVSKDFMSRVQKLPGVPDKFKNGLSVKEDHSHGGFISAEQMRERLAKDTPPPAEPENTFKPTPLAVLKRKQALIEESILT